MQIFLNIHFFLVFLVLAGCAGQPYQRAKPGNSINPTASEYNVQLGLAYLEKGDRQRAKMKLLLANEQNPSSTSAKLALAYFWKSVAEYQEAEKEYRNALKIDSKDGRVHNNYGVFLCSRGQFQQADKHFKLAQLDKSYLKSGELFENAGVCAIRMNKPEEAKNYFYRAIEHDLERPVSYFNLAKFELEANHCSQAKGWFESYRKVKEPQTPEALQLGYFIATCLERKQEAADYYQTLRKHFPDSEAFLSLSSH